MSQLLGGIEAGGTKFICAVGTGPEDIRDVIRFPTTTPEDTIRQALEFFRAHTSPPEKAAAGAAAAGALEAIGIASFGPVDLDRRSPSWGHVTSTPKPGWSGTDLAGPIARELRVPVEMDTDVNGAALGEWRWGAGRGLDTFLYVTVGTGIGGGGMARGRRLHGLVHPEMGHMLVPRDPVADPFAGGCPFHGDCLEGLASGPAIEARWGKPADELPPEHPAWGLEAEYLALAACNLTLVFSPQRLLFGGGVMEQKQLFPKIRRRLRERLNGYIRSPAVEEEIESYVVPPALGGRAGVLGALALARASLEGSR